MRVEFIIVAALAVGATFFVVVVATGLLINKVAEARRSKKRERLYQFYSGLFADLLLQPVLEGEDGETVRKEYESLLREVKNGLAWSPPPQKSLHRHVIRSVLIDFSSDLSGESMDRLQYFFESFGFVQDEVALLKSRKWWLRAQAARDLGLLHAMSATERLTSLLEDSHPDVRNQAMQSLVKVLGVDSLRPILRKARNISRWTSLELSMIVKNFEEQAYPYLIEALSYPDQSVVLFAIEMLSETGFVAAVEPLMNVAESYPNIVVRAKATEALGRLGDQRAETLLHLLLKNPYPSLRASATRALERIGSPSSVPILSERMQTGPLAERLSAARALARSGELGMLRLRVAGGETDQTMRAIALHVLEEIEGVGV
jgi:HEAT repeat protein